MRGFNASSMAMHLCQEVAGARLVDIAKAFNLNHPGSVSYGTTQIRRLRTSDAKFRGRVERIIAKIIDQST